MDRLDDRRVDEHDVRDERPREGDAGRRLGPPIDGCARKMRKKRIAVGGIVAAAHSDSQRITGLGLAASMNVHRCHAETVNVNAANDVYMRSERERSRTDAPIARIKSAASSAETAWTSMSRQCTPPREVARSRGLVYSPSCLGSLEWIV